MEVQFSLEQTEHEAAVICKSESGDWERVQGSPHKVPQLEDLDLIPLLTTASTLNLAFTFFATF